MMRLTSLLIILFYLNTTVINAQVALSVSVLNTQSQPSSNVKVWLRETNTGKLLEKRTNDQGKIVFEVPSGAWTINLVGMPDYKEYDIPEGVKGNANFEITYDEKQILEETAFIEARRKTEFIEENQSGKKIHIPQVGNAILKITLVNSQKNGVKATKVRMVSVNQKKIYTAETIGSVAKFEIPANDMYAIDVDVVSNFTFTQKMRAGGSYSMKLEYDYTNVAEKEIRDTIIQTLPPTPQASDARSLVNIFVWKDTKDAWTKEWVYVSNLYNNKVYKAQTDKNGKVQFLLPNGDKYMVHFKFQKDVDVLNLSKVHGKRNSTNNFIYRPDPKLEHPDQFMPSPENLYLEDFQTFFKKQLSPPKQGLVSLSVKWLSELVTSQSREAVLQIGMVMKSDSTIWQNTPPLNLMFVVDRSGSMAGYDRIESLKQSMLDFTKILRPIDNVGLISFNDTFRIDYPMQLIKKSKVGLMKMIEELEAGGGTHIESPMVCGYEELTKHYNSNSVNKLLLLTDGYGDDEPKKLINKSKEYNQKGIGITTIGVGSDYNYSLLSLLASQGGGMLEQVKDAKELHTAFNEQLVNLICPVGTNATLSISYNQKISYSQLYGYEVTSKESNKVNVHIGKLFGGQQKLCLAQFNLNNTSENIEKEPIKIEVSYTNSATQKVETITEFASLKWDTESGRVKMEIDNEIKKLYAVAITNQSIKIMVEAYAAKNYEKARRTLDRAFDQLKELYNSAEDSDIDKLLFDMQNYSKAIAYQIKN